MTIRHQPVVVSSSPETLFVGCLCGWHVRITAEMFQEFGDGLEEVVARWVHRHGQARWN